MQVIVPGGTHAGWRAVRAQASDWRCPGCGAYLRYYWLKCPVCESRRPE